MNDVFRRSRGFLAFRKHKNQKGSDDANKAVRCEICTEMMYDLQTINIVNQNKA